MAQSGKARAEKAAAAAALMNGLARNQVAAGFRRCTENLSRGEWLGVSNVFRVHGPIQCLTNSFDLSPHFDDACEYAAASAVLHCTDAWGYLGRALSALAAGELNEVAHLAYYAQVRSAAAILATQGLLLGNSRHIALMENGQISVVSQQSTHEAVWDLLRNCSLSPQVVTAVGKMVRISSHTLSEWLEARDGKGNTSSTISTLIQRWGIDLDYQKSDRQLRNIASYSPGRIELDAPHFAEWIKQKLLEAVALLEPGNTPFIELDRQLLLQAFRSVSEPRRQLDFVEITRRLINGPYAQQVGEALASLIADRTSLIFMASTHRTPAYPISTVDIEGLIGRALILCRLATGFSDNLRTANTLNPEVLAPWADHTGKRLGFWDPAPRPSPLSDLWQPLADAIEEIDDRFPTGPNELNLLVAERGEAVTALTTLPRAALWSLSA